MCRFSFLGDEPLRCSIQEQLNRGGAGEGGVPWDGAKADIKVS
jgi:hypothetical protein